MSKCLGVMGKNINTGPYGKSPAFGFFGWVLYVNNHAEIGNCTVGSIWLTLTLPMRAAASGSCGMVDPRDSIPAPGAGPAPALAATATAAKQIALTSRKRPSLDRLHF